jgi:hypothetical protein
MLPPGNKITIPAMKRLQEDESFGTNTQAMVREFQRLNQVNPDGVVGPITSYLIFPFISFTAQLAGKGRIRGRRGEQLVARPQAIRAPFGGFVRFGAAKAKSVAGATTGSDSEEEEGITVDVTVGSGNGNSFKPWFVLKPSNDDDDKGPEAEGTIGVESTILRLKGFEFGGGLEFSRPLIVQGQPSWQWAGTISGSYTNIKTKDETLSLSPIVDVSVKQGLILGAGIGAEASIQIIDDTLQLSVGGKVAAEMDPHGGTLQVGGAVSVGLKFKFEVLRFGK